MDTSAAQLEATLKQLAEVGTLIDDDGQRQRWRVDPPHPPFILHFYPRPKKWWRRILRSNAALNEFLRLQWLQKANVPALHARSILLGFRLRDEIGDALIADAPDPSSELESLAFESAMTGAARATYLQQLIDVLHGMAKAGFGHRSLRLRRFSVSNGRLILEDARGLHRGGLRLKQLFELAHDARLLITRGDVIRAWISLGPDQRPPDRNFLAKRLWRRFDRSTVGDNEHFGRLRAGDWCGVFTRRAPQPYSWSAAARLRPTREQWLDAWTMLLPRIESREQLEVIKSDASGDILSGSLELVGRSFDLIVKRPRIKFWFRHITQFLRGSRTRRTWKKTWKMLIRNVPSEFPMMFMERKRFGYTLDSIAIFERVPGPTLAAIDLDTLQTEQRDQLFHRTGELLRRIDDLGFMHADAKSTNWIVFDSSRPILIDVDGVRHYRWSMMGLNRLLRAMKQHAQYTPADSKSLCLGYAPEAKLSTESAEV